MYWTIGLPRSSFETLVRPSLICMCHSSDSTDTLAGIERLNHAGMVLCALMFFVTMKESLSFVPGCQS